MDEAIWRKYLRHPGQYYPGTGMGRDNTKNKTLYIHILKMSAVKNYIFYSGSKRQDQ